MSLMLVTCSLGVQQVTKAMSWSTSSSNLSEDEINERSCCIHGTVTVNIIL
jgi:hypothetical protein